MPHYYQVYLFPRPGVTLDQIAVTMNLAIDWCRYDEHNWLIYTTSDAKHWYARLENYAKPEGKVFICKLDKSDYWGSLNKIVWEWLKKAR